MSEIDHAELERWAKSLGVTAILGFLCTLLIVGKGKKYGI